MRSRTLTGSVSSKLERWALVYARVALGAAFLSGIASRFGLYGTDVGYGNFANFVSYTAEVNAALLLALYPIDRAGGRE